MSEEPPLLQLKLGGDPDDAYFAWRVIVVSLMLQRTSYKQARPVLDVLFSEWPEPVELAHADPRHLEAVIRPCGMAANRVRYLIECSKEYEEWLQDTDLEPAFGVHVPGPTPETARRWPGVGKYVEDAVRLIVWRDFDMPEPEDPKLAAWHRWNAQSSVS